MGVVAFYFPRLRQAGGAERMICLLANEFSRRGYDVHLMSLDPLSATSFYPLASLVTWYRLGQEAGFKNKLQRVRDMTKIMRQARVRVLVGFVMSGDKTVYAAARLAGVALVAAERNGPSMYRLRFGALQRWQYFGLLHLCDAITVQFPQYIAHYPRSLQGRMVSIGNPVSSNDLNAAPQVPGCNGRFELLAVSRLDQVQKNLDCLVEAFALIADERPLWDLRIIGEGEHEMELRALIEKRHLNDRIKIEKPTDRIEEIYSKAQLFCLPSRWEGFPNALAEALAAGLPAVGFANSQGVAQLIRDGETGWLACRREKTHSLARSLGDAMSDGFERKRRGALAIKQMHSYAPEVQYQHWLDLVHRLTGDD